MSVDDDLFTAALRSTFETLGPLAFGADTTAGAEFDAEVTGLAFGDDGSPNASGTLTFTATFDPGDGTRTTTASVPITCTLTTTP